MLDARLDRRTAGLAVISLALLATSCDPYPAFASYAVGLRSAGDGDVVIEYIYCPGEMIDGVQLVQVVGKDPTIGDADDPVLWEITADGEGQSRRPRPTRIILGGSVLGFTEAIPLTGALQAGVPYAVHIESSQSRFGGTATFEIDELETDRILSAGRHLSEEEFAERGKKKCRDLNSGSASDAAQAAV